MTTITVQLDISLPTTDGSYLALYTTSFPIASNFGVLEGAEGALFDFVLPDADVKEDGLLSVHQQIGTATGLLTVYSTVSGGTAVLDGYYAVRSCFVDQNYATGNNDRFRIWATRVYVKQ